MNLGIVTTHPIQYYAPWFKYMSKYMNLNVFYLHNENDKDREKGDFGISHEWDIDLLSGYKYKYLKNISKAPSVNTFNGCNTPEIYKIIKESSFDAVLVLGWNNKSFWQTIIACKIYKVPVLVRGDSNLLNDNSFIKRYIKKLIYPIMLNLFDLILTVGNRNREYLEYYGVSKKRIVFVPHFINQDFFVSKVDSSYNLRSEFNISKLSTILLFVGKFSDIKNPLLLLKALKILKRNNIDITGIFVGTGKLEITLKEYSNAYLSGSVHFLGFKNQSELSNYYAQSDILIVPSFSETWGLVVNESFSLLTPAIVSDRVGCAVDLIIPSLTGDIFKSNDEKDLAKKIESFILNSDKNVVSNNIKEKNKIYSFEYATKNLIKAINSLEKK